MQGIELTNAGSTSSSNKGKQVAQTKIIAEAQKVDDLTLPALAVYKQKYVAISRALDSAEAKLAKASGLAVGSLHDLKIKVPVKVDPEVVSTINRTVHEQICEQYVAVLTDKVTSLKKARNELVPAFTAELQTAGDKLLNENTTKNSTEEYVKYWTELTHKIAQFNDMSFKTFVDTFRAKVAMGSTPSMVGYVSDSDNTIESDNDTNNVNMEFIEPIGYKQKKKSQGWRRRQKQTKKEKVLLQTTKQTTTATTSKGPKAERQKTPKNVSVNNISSLKYLPMYVWKCLDRGTNFQLTKYCSYHQCQKDFQEMRKRIEVELDRAKSNDVVPFVVNKNVLDISFSVVSRHLFDKTVFNRNRFHKSKFGINKMINKSFEFLVENNLVVTCADKNMGLTIMDFDWYNYEVNNHLNNLTVYKRMTPDWSLNTIEVYAELFEVIMGISNKYTKKYLSKFLDTMLEPDQEFPPPYFYIIPKLHKNPISSRPITPSFAWITSDISKFLANKWSPLLKKCGYILPNSLQLVKDLEAINSSESLPLTANLYTWDIKNMYTNIDLDDLYIRIKAMLIRLNIRPEEAEYQVNLLKWVNNNSYVKYQDSWYKQIKGLAMGSAVAPVAANLYMAKILIESFGEHNNMYWDSIIYIRSYIDDVFAIMSEDFSMEIIGNRISATSIPSGFDLEGNMSNKVSFLDLNLGIALNVNPLDNVFASVTISPYNKDTNVHAYTDTDSYYPYNYRYSWIRGESIRLIRNSDTLDYYEKALFEFKHFLQNRKYPIVEINKNLTINNYSDRNNLLNVVNHNSDFISQIDFVVPIDNNPSRDVIIKLFKKVFKIYNYNASVQSNRIIKVAFPVRKGTAVIDILNKAKKKVLSAHLLRE